MNPEVNLLTIVSPQNSRERLHAFVFKTLPTKELMDRLRKFESGEMSIDNIGTYIEKETAFYENVFPPKEARYKNGIEQGRKQAAKMKELFENKNYLPLIKIVMNRAVREWYIAERKDGRRKEWSSADEKALEEAKRFNTEKESGEDHGMPPEVFESGGQRNRQESERLVRFAAVLASAAEKS